MLIDIYIKFREDSLNGSVTEFKGNNSKSITARVTVLALCTSNVD